ncbi:PPC domain-containing DNA-binding protein [Methanobacterium sp.]|uniref:PPC domain-containing DNA-binding protein n=1 Tax=Methanobacterium sp. TaxID=2164 RepID=UPI003158EE16
MIISRLKPHEDLKKGIINISKQNRVKSGIIICIVGSLNSATLRMADGNYKTFMGPFEIVSAEGTISADGVHIHMSISDAEGHVFGGHLSDGCIINTTAEIGILKSDKTLIRVFDPKTGYKELIIDD